MGAAGDQNQKAKRSWSWGGAVSRGVLAVVVGTVVLTSWLVAGVSLALLYHTGLAHGMGTFGAAALAVPATFIPAWRSWAAMRSSGGTTGALVGHLWVLNGSVGYAVLVLAALGVWDLLFLPEQASSFSLALAAAVGFLALFGGVAGVNFWLFGRMGRPAPDETNAGSPASVPGEAGGPIP